MVAVVTRSGHIARHASVTKLLQRHREYFHSASTESIYVIYDITDSKWWKCDACNGKDYS